MSRLRSERGDSGDGGLPEHVRELLAGRALGDLSFEESDALDEGLTQEHAAVGTMDAESVALEGTAGLVYLALASGAAREMPPVFNRGADGAAGLPEEMPGDAMLRLRRLAETYIAARGLGEARWAEAGDGKTEASTTGAREKAPARGRSPIVVRVGRRVDGGSNRAAGWLALAAGVAVVATVGFIALRGGGARGPGAIAAGEVLRDVRARPDAVSLAWGEWTDETVAAEVTGVTGEVVWSDEAQSGVLKFENLPFVAGSSYQLWIIDAERGMEQRVSGAVFQGGEKATVVQIEPLLRIERAAAFAVTIEQPGGTWVSDMTRRVVIAAR